MNIFLDPERNLVIEGSSTKASKKLKKEYGDYNLLLVVGNVSKTMSKIHVDFTYFGYSERSITPTQFYKLLEEEENNKKS